MPRGRALRPGELRALFDAVDEGGRRNPTLAARDAALLAVLYGCGLRRAEVVSLDLDDYQPEETGATLKVRGKGNKERLAHVNNGVQAALEVWVAERGGQPGPLFLPVNKAGRTIHRRMTGQAVLWVAQQRAAQAAVEHFTPHDLRRSFVSDLLDAGADLSTVQQAAGHAQVATTARYDRRGEAAKRRAAGLLYVPYRTVRGLVRGRQAIQTQTSDRSQVQY